MSDGPAPGAPQATPGQTGAPAPAGAPAPQPPSGQAPPQQQGTPNTEPQDVSSLPEWAQKLITSARAEAAKHRTDKQTAAQQAQAAQQQRDAVLKALGLAPDGKETPPDPEKLAKQVSDAKAVAWENAVHVQILRVATRPEIAADADALLDSNSFLDSLAEFVDDDPNSREFRDKITAHIKAFIGKHPKFKTAPAGPARSGGDHPGGGGAPNRKRPTSLMEAVRRHYNGSS